MLAEHIKWLIKFVQIIREDAGPRFPNRGVPLYLHNLIVWGSKPHYALLHALIEHSSFHTRKILSTCPECSTFAVL